MTRSSVFGCQPNSGLAWMKMTPSSKLTSFHIRVLDLALPHPVSRIAENSRRSSSLHAAKNFRSSSDVMNRGSARLGMRNFSMSVTGIGEQMVLLDRPAEEGKQAAQLVVNCPDGDA